MITERTMHVVALVAIIIVGLALLFVSAEGARSIPNDAVDDALTIETVPYQDDAVDLGTATITADEPPASCLSARHTAWYLLKPDTDVPLTAWVVPEDSQDGRLDVALSAWRREADGTLSEIICVDDRGRGAEQLVMAALAGEVYLFQVGAEELAESKDAQTVAFRLDQQRPPHDLFAFARSVDRTPYRDVAVDASGARREPGEMYPSCAEMDATTWYAISTPEDAVLSASVRSADPLVPTDVAVALSTGASIDALLEVACRDDAGVGDAERLEAPVDGGEVYWLQVGAVLGDEAGPGLYSLDVRGMQTLDLAPVPDVVYGTEPLAVSAAASSGLPVSTETEGPCEVRDGSLVALGAGLCTIVATQSGDDDWAPARPATTTLRIDPGRQSIELEPLPAMVVGDSEPVIADVVSGLPVAIEADGPCAVEAGTLVTAGAGTCLITASQAGDADWAPAEPVSVSVVIGRGPQTVALDPLPSLTVGESAEVETSSSVDLSVALAAEGSCRLRGRTLRAIGAGPCTVTASQAGDDDWVAAEPVSRTTRIGRGRQAIALEPLADTVFGAAPVPLEAEADSGLAVAFETEGPCTVEAGTLVTSGAGSCTISAAQAGDADWAPAEPVITEIDIAPASQAIALEPIADTVFGAAPLPLEAAADSGLPVGFRTAGPCRVEADRLTATGAGVCILTATQPGDTDWAAAEPVSRRITIAPAGQAVELEPLPALVVGDATELVATSDSGLPVGLEASGPCLVAGGQLRAIGAGPCTVTASQAGDDDWVAAEPVSRTTRIGRGRQAIALEPLADTMLGSSPIELEASSSSGLPVEFEATGSCNVEEGRLILDESGPCTVTASQPGDADWAAAETSVTFEVQSPMPSPTPSPTPSPSPTPTPSPTPSPSPTPAPSLVSPASAQEDLIARTTSLGCEPLGLVPAQDPLPNGALAGVDCIGPLDGVAELKLFTFPGTYRLRLYHRARVDDADAVVLPDPRACQQGQSGVRKWEHGRVACWLPRGGSKPVLHWTDERTGLYGVLRGEAGTKRRLGDLWQAVMVELTPGVDQASEDRPQDTP